MTKLTKLAAVAFVATAVVSSPSPGAVKKPAPKTSPAKAPAKSSTTNKATAGTTQLKGSEPKFGETWTLGKSYPWNFTLDSAEYTVEQLKIGEAIYCPKANEKLLVLHYTVHNPQKDEALMRFDTLRFTCVDPKDTNWEGIGDVGADKGGEPYESYSVNMKPAQKAKLLTGIVVPAAGVLPKLIIKGSDDLVLRYDLRGKVKALQAPFADPDDKAYLSALGTVPAEKGVFYPSGDFDIRLDEVSTSTSGKFGDVELEEGSYWLILKLTARNETTYKNLVRFDSFAFTLKDQDGMDIDRVNGAIYAASRNVDFDTQLDKGKEAAFRVAYQIASDQKPQTFIVKQNEECRAYAYDASSWGK